MLSPAMTQRSPSLSGNSAAGTGAAASPPSSSRTLIHRMDVMTGLLFWKEIAPLPVPMPSKSRIGLRASLVLLGRRVEQPHALERRRRKQPAPGVDEPLVAAVRDVQVAHRELADAVLRRELSLAALHGQPLGLVGEVGALRVEDRVIVAAAKLEGDLARDRLGDPALQRLAQHDRLRVEPAAFVEDRKSTRLNSSHLGISYVVFCLNKE